MELPYFQCVVCENVILRTNLFQIVASTKMILKHLKCQDVICILHLTALARNIIQDIHCLWCTVCSVAQVMNQNR